MSGAPTLLLLLLSVLLAPVVASGAEACRRTTEAVIEEGRHPDLRRSVFSRVAPKVEKVYQQSLYEPVWLRNGRPSPQARALAEILRRADGKGLNAEDYDGDRWADRLVRTEQTSVARTGCHAMLVDLGLTISAMRYIEDLRIGRVDPKALNIGLDVNGKQFDLPRFVLELTRASDVARKAAEVEPRFDLYWALQSALRTYRELAGDKALNEPLPQSGTVRPGERYKGLGSLIHRLKRFGDLEPAEVAQARRDVYAEPVVGAVKRFQRRHGIGDDGVIGERTFNRLNAPVADRVKQIELTLERIRWLPNDLGHRPIIVNVPEFRLYALEKTAGDGNYRVALEMPVIVGEAYPKNQTPLFSGKMTSVVFSPYWNVPYSILRRELYPKIRNDPGYLSRNSYQIVERYDPRASALAPTPVNIERLRSGELRLRQTPGDHNALGEVKFLFPNQHSVYLHGTPKKSLFAREQRDFSHGCIRLQDAPGFADYVLDQEEGWDRTRVDSLIANGSQRHVNLSLPLDVYILYATATVERGTGKLFFFNDIYGHDAKLQQAVAAAYH